MWQVKANTHEVGDDDLGISSVRRAGGNGLVGFGGPVVLLHTANRGFFLGGFAGTAMTTGTSLGVATGLEDLVKRLVEFGSRHDGRFEKKVLVSRKRCLAT